MYSILAGFRLTTPRSLDGWSHKFNTGTGRSIPYASVTEALSTIPVGLRYEGFPFYVKTAGGVIKSYVFTADYVSGAYQEIGPGYDIVTVPAGQLYTLPAKSLLSDIILITETLPDPLPVLYFGTSWNFGTSEVSDPIGEYDLAFGRSLRLQHYCTEETDIFVHGFTGSQTFKICYT